MIKFFRHIRKSLLMENPASAKATVGTKTGSSAEASAKAGKYFKYAIGEIILVVIGILIALSINNWNEQSKNEATAIQLLKQVQTDLVININESEEIIEYLRSKDSLIYRVMNDSVSKEDYKSLRPFNTLITNSLSFDIEYSAFNSLIEQSENFSKHLKHLTDDLKSTYSKDKSSIEYANKLVVIVSDNAINFLQNNFDGFSKLVYNRIPSENIVDYYLNNPEYKNRVARYHVGINNLFPYIISFRQKTIGSYESIAKTLDIDLSKMTDSLSYLQNADTFKSAIGTYIRESDSLTISIDDDKIWLNDDSKKRIFPINDVKFTVENIPVLFQFKKDKQGNITAFEGRQGNIIQEFIKVN